MKILSTTSLTCLLLVVFFVLSIQVTNAQVEKDTLLASQYFQKADSLLTARKHETSIEYFQKALPLYQEVKAWEKVASCYNKISENQWRNRELEESLFNSKRVIEMNTAILEENNIERVMAFDNIGSYYLKSHNFENAFAYYTKALNMKKDFFSNNTINIGISYSYLGITSRSMNKYKNALQYHGKALDIFVKTLGVEDEKVGKEYSSIGRVYKELRKYHNAIESFKKAIKISEKN